MPEPHNNFVADESVDFRIVKRLRELGADVYSILEQHRGISDKEVLSIAVERNALLITEDKDFGELVFRLKLEHKGILLLRDSGKPENITPVALSIDANYDELKGNFAVIDSRRLRISK